ncbi:MAG TPA: protein phosphatase 2C domain-containing protein [Acidimicrobiales bacterium]|nr:protein phosphatase 2C domain-containing protein [Acidimicrobiales bacterium]
MLRSYGESGLLAPAAVDALNGYRYYSVTQVQQARLVGLLRKAAVPVADIAAFLNEPRADQIEQWQAAIVADARLRRQALQDAHAFLSSRRSGVSHGSPRIRGGRMKTTVTTGAASDAGGRATNEDGICVGKDVVAVADGIGGLPDGGAASRIALETLQAAFETDPTLSGLVTAFGQANQAVTRYAREMAPETAMGTTLTALACTDDAGWAVAHVGDSRLYRLRDGRLERLTSDHTVVAQLLADNRITEEEAAHHEHRYVLTRAVGVEPQVDIDYAGVSAKSGDRFLLSTDGLHLPVVAERLRQVLESGDSAQQMADALVEAAVAGGTHDNATAVVVALE